MNKFAPRPAWIFFVLVLCAVTFGVRSCMKANHAVFLTATSPNHTYSVNVKGHKGRTFIIPRQVKADVVKSGQSFVSDIGLHTAWDSFDISFELAYPEVRWLGDNALEFYQPQYFEDGVDLLVISNRASDSVKYLRVQALNQVLVFDLQPGTSVSLDIPARDDWRYIELQGSFSDGREIPFHSNTFDRRSTDRKGSVYQITIYESGSTIAG